MTVYPRYITEFRWLVRGELRDWSMPEGPVQSSLDDVADQISSYADAETDGHHINTEGGVIRVTRMTEEGCSDWTEDALRYFAERKERMGYDWPWWVEGGPVEPETAEDRGFNEARAARDERAA